MPARADGGIGMVQREIAFCPGQGVSAKIEVHHRTGAATRGVQGKASGKAEGVQYAAIARQRRCLPPVLTLVEKKTGFLPAQNIRLEAQTRLGENHRITEWRTGEDFSVRFPEPVLGRLAEV